MGLSYTSLEKKDANNNYAGPQDRENRFVDNLMAAKSNGYDIKKSYGIKKYRTHAPGVKSVYGKKQKRPFIPTWCKFCGAAVTYGSISKARLRAAGPAWIDTCDSCTANPDVSKEAKVYV